MIDISAVEFSSPDFRSKPLEAKVLPEPEKLLLCERLLTEFGVVRWRKTSRGELTHSCPIPNAHGRGDRNPSAQLNYRELVFTCWSCGFRSGLLGFITACRDCTPEEARRWLETQTGTGGEAMDLTALLALIDAIYAKPEPEPLPRFDRRLLERWMGPPHPYLTEHPSPEDPPGLSPRAIPAETCETFGLCYAPDYELFRDGRYVTQERIVMPVEWQNELVGWQARRIDPADEPKYHNSPNLPRDRVIYNWASRRRCVLVESPMSVLRHYHHVPEMVATFGSEVAEAQMRMLRRHDEVVVWMDNDKSGWGATRRIIEGLTPHTNVSVVASSYAADPADMQDDTVASLLQDTTPWPLWNPPRELRPLEDA